MRANLGFRSHSPCQHFPMRHPLLHTAVGALGRDHQSKSGETDAVFTRWSYPIVAFLPGVIWYVGLLLPEMTRGWLLHFPIALLIAAAFAELWGAWRGDRSLEPVVRFCVLLGAASAVATASSTVRTSLERA